MRDSFLTFLETEYGFGFVLSGAGAMILVLIIVLSACRSVTKDRNAHRARVMELEVAYKGLIDVDKEIAARKETIAELESLITDIRTSYATKRELYEKLGREISVFQDQLDLADIGMFRPVISLGSTAEYKAAIETVRERQKQMISNKTAITCPTSWTVNNSKAQGRTMINRNIRMALRAYNNECEVLINRVSWKNYDSVRGRMLKCRQIYNDLNESLGIVITPVFESLKLEELRLVYEQSFQQQEEKDRIRDEKEREREEAKAQRELQAEIARSEKREREREAALVAAKLELAAATEAERMAYQARVAELEQQLANAHERTERARSMAEQTRVGHVYIISNIGSFGEEIFKIGMTRRLEPLDRIRELGDASVPFPFQVHAMMFTEDAPTLERELHIAMQDARVNRINLRKEFFRASGPRVAELVRERFPNAIYIERPDSMEYLASLSSQELEAVIKIEKENRLPMAI